MTKLFPDKQVICFLFNHIHFGWLYLTIVIKLLSFNCFQLMSIQFLEVFSTVFYGFIAFYP